MKEDYKSVCTLKIPCNNNALYLSCKKCQNVCGNQTCPYFHLYISVIPTIIPGLPMVQQILCNALIVPIF